MQHINNMMNVKDPKIMRTLASATKLDQETVRILNNEVQELQKKLNKLIAKKPKLSPGG